MMCVVVGGRGKGGGVCCFFFAERDVNCSWGVSVMSWLRMLCAKDVYWQKNSNENDTISNKKKGGHGPVSNSHYLCATFIRSMMTLNTPQRSDLLLCDAYNRIDVPFIGGN